MNDPKLVSVQEAAQRLHASAVTIRRWCADGHLHSVRIGGRLLVRAADIDAALEHGLTLSRPKSDGS